MNKLSKQQIHHIANLARLELTDEELKIYGSQLSDILNYIGQLREVDVSGVEPTAQTAGLENIFREDEIEEWDKEEARAALEQAPEMEDGQVKVRRVID
ncbi:MAG: Asp-tRNA(Asn)/Glu-tRNA(Gln) amidotransferase subunit GatC [bacterium]|nr:Asp-tRNA(Asn)/Glu-tRNA(Gln) amidotransferase subunit GatC [bacterium]